MMHKNQADRTTISQSWLATIG